MTALANEVSEPKHELEDRALMMLIEHFVNESSVATTWRRIERFCVDGSEPPRIYAIVEKMHRVTVLRADAPQCAPKAGGRRAFFWLGTSVWSGDAEIAVRVRYFGPGERDAEEGLYTLRLRDNEWRVVKYETIWVS